MTHLETLNPLSILKKINFLKISVIYLFLSSTALAQTDCAITVSSTLTSTYSGASCTYTFQPTVTFNNKPKLIQFEFSAGGQTQYVCYNYDGTNVILLGVQSTQCGSDNAFFPNGATLLFPAVMVTLPCGPTTLSFTAYNGAAGGKPTGLCSGPTSIPITPPLPVKLVAFDGETVNEGILLKWKTVEEINSDRFVVQRSLNAKIFTDITEIKSAGTINEPIDYSYLDNTDLKGTIYYRLKQIDNDGIIDFSKIISVNRLNDEIISIYPNPLNNERLFLSGTNEKILSAQITSIYGDVFLLNTVELNENIELIIPKTTKSGVYILQIQTTAKKITRKIIIE